jgi:hypothetical protein
MSNITKEMICDFHYLRNVVNDLYHNVVNYQKTHNVCLQKHMKILAKYEELEAGNEADTRVSDIKTVLNDLGEQYDNIIKHKDMQDQRSLDALDKVLSMLNGIKDIDISEADEIRRMCRSLKNRIRPVEVESRV